MKVWRGEGKFLDFLKADPEVTLSDAELGELFDLGYHFKHVDTVFARVFGEQAEAQHGTLEDLRRLSLALPGA